MAKTRLNMRKRERLVTFARENIPSNPHTEPKVKAKEKAEGLLREAIKNAFPEEDLKVLRKYGMLYNTHLLQFTELDSKCVRSFWFEEQVQVPSGSTARGLFPVDKETMEAIQAYDKEENLEETFSNQRMRDYRALINTSRTFEDVAAVWPTAEKLREELCGTQNSVVALSSEIIERIQKDVQETESKGDNS